MRYFWKGLKHFFLSNSRHGTHSPFVYRLADEVIYRKGKLHVGKMNQSKRLMKDIADFLKLELTSDRKVIGKGRALLLPVADVDVQEVILLQQQFAVLFLTDIYKYKSDERIWKEILRSPDVIVAVDLFYFGLICYRKQQTKETFKLRFPYRR